MTMIYNIMGNSGCVTKVQSTPDGRISVVAQLLSPRLYSSQVSHKKNDLPSANFIRVKVKIGSSARSIVFLYLRLYVISIHSE